MLLLLPLLIQAGLSVSASIDACPGYAATNIQQNANSLTATLSLAGDACNTYGDDITDLTLLVEYQAGPRLHVKVYDTAEQVYQIPEALLSLPSGADGSSDGFPLTFSYVANPFSFAVSRSDTQEPIFNTSGANLIFETQYIRLRTSLPSNPYIYGLGEDSDSLRRPTSNYSRTLWNVGDPFLASQSNLYGSHPVYVEMRDGQAHGVFLGNSDGTDVKINSTEVDGRYLEYNAIGGVFDLYFLPGPSPSDVSQQYASVVGPPAEQAYWTYGFHQCKYGWQDVFMLAEVVQNYSNANIPLEVLWSDIDYMDLRRTWTLDPDRFPLYKMQELVTYLHDHNQSFIMMVDPPVSLNDSASYNNGLNDDVYIKHTNGTVFVASMWPGATSWVDWLHPNAQKFWSGQVSSFFNADSGVNVDGIWIDMNEPANFCSYPCPDPNGEPPDPPPVRTTWPPLPGFPADFQPPGSTALHQVRKRQSSTGNHTGVAGRNLLDPPYKINNTDGSLDAGTLWPDLEQYGGYSFYDLHNLFASGDNGSLWSQYRISIKQNMEFASIYQVPTVGADVCGFNLNTTETLCARWAVLGAFYPFYRNHADITANQQEFYLWPLVTAAAQGAIRTRMQLLDYFYTQFHYQTVDGVPRTILPLFYVYPNDAKTLENDLQFFFGPSLLVSPVTEENSTSVDFYLPNDTFYDFFSGEKVQGTGSVVTRSDVNYTDIPVHIRGGAIIPIRIDGANNTKLLRELDFDLLIAPDANGAASGRLFLDDGESLQPAAISEVDFAYSAGNASLSVSGTFGYQTANRLRDAVLLGTAGNSSSVGAGNGTSAGAGDTRQGRRFTLDRPLTGGFVVTLS